MTCSRHYPKTSGWDKNQRGGGGAGETDHPPLVDAPDDNKNERWSRLRSTNYYKCMAPRIPVHLPGNQKCS